MEESSKNSNQDLNLSWKDIESTSESLIFHVLNASLKDISAELIDEPEAFEELDSMPVCDSTQLQTNSGGKEVVTGSKIPTLLNYPGKYNFGFYIQNKGGYKSSWEYSHKLNQVFINMNKILMVQFAFDCPDEAEGQLYIRAMPVYCYTDYIGLPVNRCTIHSVEDDPGNEAHTSEDICYCNHYNLVGHVLRSHTAGSVYFYSKDSKRHSVILPMANFPQGRNMVDILYSFACKTSCEKGMQRRPINLLFTLENAKGDVLGRSTLAVKICSCPKRDRDRIEKDMPKSTRSSLDEDDPLIHRGDLINRLRSELRQFNKLQTSIGKTIRNIEKILTDV